MRMSKQEKKTLVPVLRFSEFLDAGEWKGLELGPLTTKVGSGITPTGGDKNYKSEGRPFVRSQNVGWDELILDDVAFIDEEIHQSFDSTEIKVSDVLLNITGASIGRSAVADSRITGGNVNQHVCIIRTKQDELNPVLLNHFLISERGQKQIDSFQAGGNRQGLNFAQIRSFKIPLPPTTNEQRKICDCLTSIGELITTQTRKLDALKIHKKGLMQQLFPVKGETVPKRRFPEFRDKGEWGANTFGGAATFLNGRAYSQDELLDDGKYRVLRVGNFFSSNHWYYSDLELEENKYCDKGDLLYAWSASFGPRIWQGEKVIYHYHIWKVLKKKGVDRNFLFNLLEYETERMKSQSANGLGLMHITKGAIENWQCRIPKIEEQQKIADFLSSIDELITAQTQKLKTLKAHKNGLVQQLFPTKDEVSA